ncbi:Zn-dependent exopeptidase [Byssothecium circinans]|uniref:Peptide hydrolase n=1 Tax=Byssothecium circinans TaxID=147558 RepID=A0A6A5TSJ3_9PLEO|nr:Zn-dependent exopeptidase [Byssothecium circinans]
MKTTPLIAAAGIVAPAVAQGYKPAVSSSELAKLVNIDELVAGAQDLYDIAKANGGQRAFGGAGHNATQPFVEEYVEAQTELTVGGTDYVATYLTYSPSANLTKPLVAVSNIGCNATDYPSTVTGNIAYIKRGTCPFSEKVTNAKTAGAVGVIIYNHINKTVSGTLGGPGDWLPSVTVEYAPGQAILAQLSSAAEVSASIYINVIQENRTTFNVIAETKTGDHNNVLALGAHTDSVPEGPGINDDGSGTIGVLTVAKHLSKFSVKNAVRFGFWSAEEFGLLGPYHYVKTLNGTISGNASEISKVRAYVNFDMIASPNYALGVHDGDGSTFNFSGPPGSDTIEKNFGAFFTSKNLSFIPSEFSGRSDYAAFLENGIAAGGVDTGAEGLKTEEEAALFGGEAGVAYDINYHGPGDTVDNLALDAFLWNSQAIADAVGRYANDFGDIPKPNITSLERRGTEMAKRGKENRNGSSA